MSNKILLECEYEGESEYKDCHYIRVRLTKSSLTPGIRLLVHKEIMVNFQKDMTDSLKLSRPSASYSDLSINPYDDIFFGEFLAPLIRNN